MVKTGKKDIHIRKEVKCVLFADDAVKEMKKKSAATIEISQNPNDPPPTKENLLELIIKFSEVEGYKIKVSCIYIS